MSYIRTEEEHLTDNAVLLALWAMSQERSPKHAVGDPFKLQKLTFLTTYDLYHEQFKALNLEFYRWKNGPYSQYVLSNVADLQAAGLLFQDEEETFIPDEGLDLARSFTDEVLRLPENKPVIAAIEARSYEVAPLETRDLLERVYDMRIPTVDHPHDKQTIRTMPLRTTLTLPLEPEEAKAQLVLPSGWLTTLELSFHPQAFTNLQRGIQDFRHGKYTTVEALLADV